MIATKKDSDVACQVDSFSGYFPNNDSMAREKDQCTSGEALQWSKLLESLFKLKAKSSNGFAC